MAKRKVEMVAGAVPPRPSATGADSFTSRFLDPDYYAGQTGRGWVGELADSDTTVRVMLVREGLPAQVVPALADVLDLSRDDLTRKFGLARATVDRKLRRAGHLGQADSERMLGLATLIALVERLVGESGDPEGFDAGLWTAQWLQTPAPALGGRPPLEFMDTADGRAAVIQLVTQMQSGAYA